MKRKFKEHLKKEKKILVGMIHVPALPGTPKNYLTKKEIINKCVKEAKILKKHEFNTVMIENMHDIPYTKNIHPRVPKIMAKIGKEIKKLGLYCGIQILAAGNKQALKAAKKANLDFIRAEGFVYAHIADEGYIESCAGELLRYRKKINAEEILIFTDIKKKHCSHSITKDTSIEETAHTAEFFLSDGIIVTGVSTGTQANIEEVKRVKKTTKLPVLIGSGITSKNLKAYFNHTDLFIVGSYIKEKGYWKNELDEIRIEKLINTFKQLLKKRK